MAKFEGYDGTDWVTLGSGTVTSVTGVAGQTTAGGTATDPTIGLTASGVTAGTYTLANAVVDTYGRITSMSSGTAVEVISGTANQINITGAAATPTVAIASNPIISGTASITIPVGTTAQRPVTPTVGMFRINTSL
jgi:hypothetical protein